MTLKRPRMIDVHLEDSEPPVGSTSAETGYSYRVHVGTRRVHSELLRVNRESRQAASEFCRARVPCKFFDNGVDNLSETDWKGHLVYNPECDFLHITTKSLHLPDFLYDLKTTYDPDHVGLRNLAIQQNTLVMLYYTLSLSNHVDAKERETVGEIFSQLRQVFFVKVTGVGRQLPRRTELPIERDVFNRSYPVMAQTATFERLRRDPRDIAPDLDWTLMTTFDNHRTVQDWNQVLGTLGVCPPRHISYRLLLASEPRTPSCRRIIDRESANTFLEEEDERWAEGSRVAQELDSLNDDLERTVRPAVGFWLFPLEALDALARDGKPWHEFALLDLRKYWPELALLDL